MLPPPNVSGTLVAVAVALAEIETEVAVKIDTIVAPTGMPASIASMTELGMPSNSLG